MVNDALYRISGHGSWEGAIRGLSPLLPDSARLLGTGRCEVIVGLGADIAEVSRIEAAIARHGRVFIERIFTPHEIAYCARHRDRAERYAARFAAKEAAMKALGTGWARGVRWVDIEVTRLASGQPTLELHGAARRHAERIGVSRIHVSLTHSGNLAFAEVILEN